MTTDSKRAAAGLLTSASRAPPAARQLGASNCTLPPRSSSGPCSKAKGSRQAAAVGSSGSSKATTSSASQQRWHRLSRVIDRRGNRYTEHIEDAETGQVVRHVDEPLTKHTGRGSARKAAASAAHEGDLAEASNSSSGYAQTCQTRAVTRGACPHRCTQGSEEAAPCRRVRIQAVLLVVVRIARDRVDDDSAHLCRKRAPLGVGEGASSRKSVVFCFRARSHVRVSASRRTPANASGHERRRALDVAERHRLSRGPSRRPVKPHG